MEEQRTCVKCGRTLPLNMFKIDFVRCNRSTVCVFCTRQHNRELAAERRARRLKI